MAAKPDIAAEPGMAVKPELAAKPDIAAKPDMAVEPARTSKLSIRRQLLFWALVLAVLIFLLWLFNDILLPFVVAMGLAYLLDPMVERMRGWGINRAIAALIIVAGSVIVLVAAIVLLAPVLGEQLSAFIHRLPGYAERVQQLVAEANDTWLGRLLGDRLPEAQKSLTGMTAQAAGWAGAFLGSIWSGGKSLVSVVSLIVITPVVAFYLLVDWDRTVAAMDNWVPRPHRGTVHGLTRDIDAAISGFMRGQALCCVILGILYCGGLMLIGLNFALLIGIVAGILSFVPYVGTIVGLLMAGGVAIAQFWPDWVPLALVIGLFSLGQALEGNVLQPFLVGNQVGLHPVWLMFSLLAFGYLFGFVGLLVAVPVAAAIGVLVRFLLRQYLASPYYTGE